MDDVVDGVSVRAQLFGERGPADRGAMDRLAPDVSGLVDDALWKAIWPRGDVDLRTKSICTVVALLTAERFEYMRMHVRGARRLGIARSTLVDVVCHLVFYISLPAVHEGLRVIEDVYAEAEAGSGEENHHAPS